MKKSERYVYLYVLFFFLFNMLNGYLVTTNIFNKEITIYPRTFSMIFNSFIGDMGVLLVVFGLGVLIFKNFNHRFRFYFIFTIIFSIMIYSISMYMQYFGTLFSFKNSNVFVNEAGGVMIAQTIQAVVELVKEQKIIYFLPTLIFGFLIYLNRNQKFVTKQTPNHDKSYRFFENKRVIYGSFILLFGIIISFASVTSYKNTLGDNWFSDNRIPIYEAEYIGIYNFYFAEFFEVNFLKEERNNLTLQDENDMNVFLNRYSSNCYQNEFDLLEYCKVDDFTNIASGYNIIYLQLESMSDFVINLELNGNEVTPNLNRLVEEGIYFSNYYTDVGIGNTSDNEFTVNTGLLPDGTSIAFFEYIDQDFQTLAGVLGDNGYETYSFHGNTGVFYDRENVHESMLGYDEHYEIDELNFDEQIYDYLSDNSLLNQTLDFMETYNEPYLIYDILVTSHLPYSNDELIQQIDWGKEFNNTMIGRFLNVTHYVDEAIGNFINNLETEGMLDNTIIIMAADHGGNISKDELELIFSDMTKLEFRLQSMKIPLIIYNPTLLGNENIDLVRSPRDISRTIFNLLGIDTTYYFGVNALSDEPSFAYNPRSLDFVTDDYFISIISQEYDQLRLTTLLEVEEYMEFFYYFKDTQDNLIYEDYFNKEE